MKQFFTLLLGSVLYCAAGYCQSPMGIPGIPSPNVTAFDMINEVPVSLYTGKCDITIPVYELKEGDISVPIYLAYNSSGVRPDVHPGWVGQNWSLQAGGMITRTVKGLPDETNTEKNYTDGTTTTTLSNDAGYLDNYTLNANTDWSSSSNIKSCAMAESWKDTEPDMFTFNVNGMTGTFHMGEDGKFHCRSNPDIQINVIVSTVTFPDYAQVMNPNNSSSMYLAKSTGLKNKKIIGFELVMNNGFIYSFGSDAASDTDLTAAEALKLEYSTDFFSQTFLEKNFNTWMLTKITSPNNSYVTFNYQRGKTSATDNYPYPVVSFRKTSTYLKASSSVPSSALEKLLFPFSGDLTASSLSINSHYSGDIIFPVYLASIETGSKKLEFSISATTELKYDYSAILTDLTNQISKYTPCFWGNTPRSVLDYSTACIINNIPVANGFDCAWFRSDLYNNDVNWLVNVHNTRSDFYSYYENFLCAGKTPYYSTSQYGLGAPPIAEGIDLDRLKWFKLDNIKLYDKFSNTCTEEWTFGYNNNSDERLMLTSLQEKGRNSAVKNPYTFEYEDYYGAEKYTAKTCKLPNYNSSYLDHWGYYNGTNSEITSFTNQNMSDYHDKRNASEDYMYAGQLNRINYPTGGNVEFTYEPNRYSTLIKRNVSTGNFEQETYATPIIGGGLRIKNIKYKDGTDVKSEKNYLYSDGILGQEIKYYWSNYSGNLYNSTDKVYSTYTSDRFVSENLLPGCGGMNYSVTYPKVEERITGAGKTEYYYSNHLTNPDENFIATIDLNKSISSPFTSKDFERGQLLRKIIKDENGIIKKKERYTYSKNTNVAKDYIPAIASWRFRVLENTWSIEGTSYKNYIYPYYLTEKIDSIYGLTGNFVTRNVVTYENNAHNLLQNETVTNANEKLKTTNSYIFDYPDDFADEDTPMGQMAVFNILTPVVDQYKYKNDALVGGTSIVYGNMDNGVYAPYEIYLQKGDLPEEKRVVFDFYNANGQPLYYVKDNTEKIVSIWGYNYQFPIAQIKGATIYEVLSALKMDGLYDLNLFSSQTTPNITTLRASLTSYFSGKNVEITTCTYHPRVGITSMTDPREVTTYYEYDDFGRLKESYYYENGDTSKKRVIENHEYNYHQ